MSLKSNWSRISSLPKCQPSSNENSLLFQYAIKIEHYRDHWTLHIILYLLSIPASNTVHSLQQDFVSSVNLVKYCLTFTKTKRVLDIPDPTVLSSANQWWLITELTPPGIMPFTWARPSFPGRDPTSLCFRVGRELTIEKNGKLKLASEFGL